jgi:hypothetical protein
VTSGAKTVLILGGVAALLGALIFVIKKPSVVAPVKGIIPNAVPGNNAGAVIQQIGATTSSVAQTGTQLALLANSIAGPAAQSQGSTVPASMISSQATPSGSDDSGDDESDDGAGTDA